VDVGYRHRYRSARARAALLGTTALVAASVAIFAGTGNAQAQSTWQTGNNNYRKASNWDNGTPPVVATDSAIFANSGSITINVPNMAGPIGPGHWTFTSNAQSYSINGADVNFGVAGPTGGIISNANAGQVITIKNSIGESVTGVTVQVLDHSTLVLGGTNSYTGGTLVLGGAVQITNDSALGTGLVTLDAATLKGDGAHNINLTNTVNVNKVLALASTVDNAGRKLTLSGNIAGSGALQFIDTSGVFAGKTVLSGVNAYTGGTTVTNSWLQVNNSSAVGTAPVTLDGGIFLAGKNSLTFDNTFKVVASPSGSAIDNGGNTLTIAGKIVDNNAATPGAVTFQDSSAAHNGVTILTNDNTYSGGTVVCFCSTLQLGTLATPGSIIGPVDNEGTLRFVNSNTAGVTTLTNEGGALTAFRNSTNAATMTINNLFDPFFGPSTLRFHDAASAGNATINNYAHNLSPFGSTVAFSDNSTAGNAIINNIAAAFGSGKIKFNDNSTAGTATINNAGFGNVIFADQSTAGFATIHNDDAGVLTFKNHSSADNATIVNNALAASGGVEFLNHSTAGNGFITTNAGSATLFFDHSDGGTARFETASGGIVDFSQTTGPAGDKKIKIGRASCRERV